MRQHLTHLSHEQERKLLRDCDGPIPWRLAMPNKHYLRGRASEYRVQRELESEGFETIRTAGSHGVADVIAWNGHLVRFIQVKTFTTKKVPTFKDDVEKISAMTLPPNSQVELWIRKIGSKGWLKKLTLKTNTKDWQSYLRTATMRNESSGRG